MDIAGIASQLPDVRSAVGVVSGTVSVVIALIRVIQFVRHRRTARAETAAAVPSVQHPNSPVVAADPPPASSSPRQHVAIRTPDQRLRVFIGSTLQELAPERAASTQAVSRLKLTPILFELGARPHAARSLYRAYLAQSDIFVGIYWQSYGWVAPDEAVSGLEDEYRLSGDKPKLIYLKSPAPDREPRLRDLLDRIRADDHVAYKSFRTAAELRRLIANDLAVLLSERFDGNHQQIDASTTVDTQPHNATSNLPLQLTPLVGRESEVYAALRTLDDRRLVTLTGAGGTGKTRLAIEIAERLLDRFADGVWFVGLAPVTEPNLVLRTIALTLGVVESASRSILNSVEDFVRSRQLLLVLDNMEHLLSAAPDVAALLTASPGLKILATSREPLGLHGEWEVPVSPLTMPAPGERSPDQLAQVASVMLFVQCAVSINPGFALTEDNAAAIAAICQRLDGLPLAIELAAARLRLLSPQALVWQLGNRLGVLTGGARDLPARQRTLRGAIEWSYQLLAPGEQALFRRLAVFVGYASVDLVEQVCTAAGDLETDILDGLQSLLAKSLLVRANDQTGDAVRMLETIREYALEQLELQHEAEVTRRRHAEIFMDLAETADRYLRSGAQALWMQRLAVELDNLRATLSWAEGSRVHSLHLRLGGALARFWWRSGHLTEGRRWLEPAIKQGTDAPTAYRARALVGAGKLASAVGDYPQAIKHLDNAVALSRDLGDKWLIAYALLYRADAALAQGDLAASQALNEESLALFRTVDDDWGIGGALNALGQVATVQGRYVVARPLYEEALRRARARGEPMAVSIGLGNLAQVAVGEGNYRAAIESGTQALRASPLRETDQVANIMAELAAAAVGLGQFEQGVRLYGAESSIRNRLGVPGSPSESALHDAVIARARAGMDDDAAFERTWADGQRLSADEAVEYALQLGAAPAVAPAPNTVTVTSRRLSSPAP